MGGSNQNEPSSGTPLVSGKNAQKNSAFVNPHIANVR